ncbi:hypothetical protein ACJZ2D_003730 [Fusarium nematophilum]
MASSSMSGFRILGCSLLIVTIFGLHAHAEPIYPPWNVVNGNCPPCPYQPPPSPISNLDVVIEQTRQPIPGPPYILVTVINRNPFPITFLKRRDPLSQHANSLGLVYITSMDEKPARELDRSVLPDFSYGPVDSEIGPKDLVGLGPGGNASAHVQVGLDASVKINDVTWWYHVAPDGCEVQMKGGWDTVWTKNKNDVVHMIRDGKNYAPFRFAGHWESNIITLDVM